MGFKSMPWELYFKDSLGEFVIRQRHTNHTSVRVKKVNQLVARAKPAIAAHSKGATIATHRVGRYVNGKYEEYDAVPIKIFKAALRTEMNSVLSRSNYPDRLKPEAAITA